MNKNMLFIFMFIFLFILGCIGNNIENNFSSNFTEDNDINQNISSNFSNNSLLKAITLEIDDNYIYDNINITLRDIEPFSNSAIIKIYDNNKTHYEKISFDEEKTFYLSNYNLKIKVIELGYGYTFSAKWVKFILEFEKSNNSIIQDDFYLLRKGDFFYIDEWKISIDDFSLGENFYAAISIYKKNNNEYEFYDYENLYKGKNEINLNNKIYEFNCLDFSQGFLFNEVWIKLKINNTHIYSEKEKYIILRLDESYYYDDIYKISFESHSSSNDKVMLTFYSTNLIDYNNELKDLWQGSYLMKKNDEIVRFGKNKNFSFELIDVSKVIGDAWIKLKIHETNNNITDAGIIITNDRHGDSKTEIVYGNEKYMIYFSVYSVYASDYNVIIKSYDTLGTTYYDIMEVNQTIIRKFRGGHFSITINEIFNGFPLGGSIVDIKPSYDLPSHYIEPYLLGTNISINDYKNILMSLEDIDMSGDVLVNFMYINGTIISKELLKRKYSNAITLNDKKYLITNVKSFKGYKTDDKLITLLVNEFNYDVPIDNTEYLISNTYDMNSEIIFDDAIILFEDIEMNYYMNKKSILIDIFYNDIHYKEKIYEEDKFIFKTENKTYEIYVPTIGMGYMLKEKWAKINIKKIN